MNVPLGTGAGIHRGSVADVIAALRPRQWTKNLIVFAAAFFGFHLRTPAIFGAAGVFAIFCALSSAFYLVNDTLDIAADRLHPVKSHRPIAAGRVSVRTALVVASVLGAAALLGAFAISPAVGAMATLYVAMQIAYNASFKKLVIVDVLTIALGFIVRAFGGSFAAGVPLSAWFILCAGFLALFLAIEKRKAELARDQAGFSSRRKVLDLYSPALLGRMENVATTGAVVSYALWSSGPHVGGASTAVMMLTLPIVLFAVFRYQYLSEPRGGDGGDSRTAATERPEELLLRDVAMAGAFVLWAFAVFVVLLLKHARYIA